MTTALITGATAGLGWCFARKLAATGHDLVLVARDEARLQIRADELRRDFGVAVEVLPADLGDLAQTKVVAERAASTTAPVDLVVNNAGFGLGTGFTHSDLDDELQMFNVLCRAVLVISHAAIPVMKGRGRGAILNVSSVASFLPQGTYSSAKAWVTTFTESLAAELVGTGVQVSALCPGFTHTEFHQRADVPVSALPEIAWLDADFVVEQGLADLRRGVVVSVPSLRYKASVAALTHLPGVARREVARRTRWTRR